MLPLTDHSPLLYSVWAHSNEIWQQIFWSKCFKRHTTKRKYKNGSSKSWDVYAPHCFPGCHEHVPLRATPRRADEFVSTCVMKDIWSIKAYSFSVPFHWWARGRAGQCLQRFSALAGWVQHTHTHTIQIHFFGPFFITILYPILISYLCAVDWCREGNNFNCTCIWWATVTDIQDLES